MLMIFRGAMSIVKRQTVNMLNGASVGEAGITRHNGTAAATVVLMARKSRSHHAARQLTLLFSAASFTHVLVTEPVHSLSDFLCIN